MKNKREYRLDSISVYSRYRITTSGYTDRYLLCEGSSITIGVSVDDLYSEYTMRFEARKDFINYLMAVHGMSWEDAKNAISSAPKRAGLEWEYLGTSSTTQNIEPVRQMLDVLQKSIKREVREQYANDVELTPEAYYAFCTGLYRCNESNRLMKKRGLRNGYEVFVQPEGFEIDKKYDERRVRDALIALAKDPSRCYS